MRADESTDCARILMRSFDRDTSRELSRSPDSDVWVVREADRVRGLAVVRDRRVGFGRRFVRTACVSSVCVDPEHRSSGLGRALVDSVLDAARKRGSSLVLLIPLDEGVYARHGFVRGGSRFGCEFELPRSNARGDFDAVRTFEPRDVDGWLELVEQTARERTALVIATSSDRARRARSPRHAYVLERGGALVASITLSQRLVAGRTTLFVHELFAQDSHAAASTWAFVARFSSQVRRVRWRAGPDDPLARFAHSASALFEVRGSWMARVVDPRRALTERGFAPGIQANFVIQVRDEVDPRSERPFTLELRDGSGEVREGGTPTVRCGAATLTSLFVGARTARALSSEGLLVASSDDIARLDAAFSVPPSALQSLP
ncbi:MAG: GNAT family N-acetyltransferase [Planctomycetota bacterium]|nr:GNAT family N-acetyltransferase [Planctomycetota bacterium]